jgi:hypothetical protein
MSARRIPARAARWRRGTDLILRETNGLPTSAAHYIRRPDAALIAAADRICSRIVTAPDGKTEFRVTSLNLEKHDRCLS